MIVPPNRSDAFVDNRGFAGGERVRRWIEGITDAVNPKLANPGTGDSPYYAKDGEYILCDMSAGDITVVLPPEGKLWVSRKGASNTLTLQGTVSGTVDPTINYDGSTAALAYITEWRYV